MNREVASSVLSKKTGYTNPKAVLSAVEYTGGCKAGLKCSESESITINRFEHVQISTAIRVVFSFLPASTLSEKHGEKK